MMETILFDRYQTVLRAAQYMTLSKNQAQILVGGQRRLERLVSTGMIRARKTTDKQNGRWECNGADVVRYTIDPDKH